MATKPLTDKFIEYRRAALRDISDRASTNSNDSDDPLVDNTPAVQLSGSRRLESVVPPDWLKKIKPIETMFGAISLEMEDLEKKHTKKLQPTFGVNPKDEDALITQQTKKITRMLGEAKSEVKKLGIEKKMSTQEAYMKDNIQKLLATKLQSLELEKSKRSSTVSTSSSSNPLGEPSVPLEEDDDDDMGSVDIGFTDQQQARVQTNRIRIAQREQEIREIAEQVEQLGEMFSDIANMVNLQGSLLDRIDYNLENADHSIAQGNDEIKQVLKGERGFSKCLCLLLVLICIWGIVVVIVVMTRKY